MFWLLLKMFWGCMNNVYDYIIIGSGFAGAILAERLASQCNKQILLIEKRSHVAGNMYDYKDENGIIVHKYGPHLFRTNEDKVKEYLSLFTQWHPYQHKVLANVQDKLVPVPFNLKSLEILLPDSAASYKEKLINNFGLETKVPISILRKHQDEDIRSLGNFIFQQIYLNYTTKQWGEEPENLDFETITSRVPVHISYDDRYFQQNFQALPKSGYTKMFENMLSHPNIKIMLDSDSKNFIKLDEENRVIYFEDKIFKGNVIYTGQIDELFNYKFGELPYRSLKFVIQTHDAPYFQPVGTVNYPDTRDYTRITDYNHMTTEPSAKKTTIMYEYPQAFVKEDPTSNIPYYPIPKDENYALYKKYSSYAQSFPNLILIGRLAEYRYYDMNDIIIRALDEFERITSQFSQLLDKNTI